MADLRFDGKVAIVTGAGGGLGRQHALELARRGAKVVINDLGGSMDGSGGSSAAAEAVVAEIKAAGGEAIANGASVTDDAGVAHLVQQTMDQWGRPRRLKTEHPGPHSHLVEAPPVRGDVAGVPDGDAEGVELVVERFRQLDEAIRRVVERRRRRTFRLATRTALERAVDVGGAEAARGGGGEVGRVRGDHQALRRRQVQQIGDCR